MAKQETSSDKLKQIFASVSGGTEKDWKRLSKKKDQNGNWVREFEHKDGRHLSVTETPDGQFKINGGAATQTPAVKPAVNEAKTASTPGVITGYVEKNPEMNAAADRVIEIFTSCGSDEDIDEDSDLVKKAGRALANRYVFALCPDEDSYYIAVSAEASGFWDDKVGPADYLVPKGAALSMEAAYEYRGSPGQAIRAFLDAGFKWTESFQKHVDETAEKQGDKPFEHSLYYKAAGLTTEANRLQASSGKKESEIAADRIISILMEEDAKIKPSELSNHPDLIQKAGKALLKHYAFAVANDGDSLSVQVMPVRYATTSGFETYQRESDEPLHKLNLLPAGYTYQDYYTWTKDDDNATVKEIVADFLKAGFKWNENVQKVIDRKSKKAVVLAIYALEDEKKEIPVTDDQQAAADRIIKMMKKDGRADVDDALMKKAGIALARKFSFVIMENEDAENGFEVSFSPFSGWDQHLSSYIGHLLPKRAGEMSETAFEFPGFNDPAKLAVELHRRGFILDAEWQRAVDKDTGNDLSNTLLVAIHESKQQKRNTPKP